MKTSVKKTIKFATGVCAALGIVTLGAVVASGTAVKAVAEGLKAGVTTMKKTMADLQTEKTEPVTEAAQYVVVPAAAEKEEKTAESVEVTEEELGRRAHEPR